MLVQEQDIFVEYERELIHERTQRGRLFVTWQGCTDWGNPPYGYTYQRKTTTTPPRLLVSEMEPVALRQMYWWSLAEL